MWSHDENKEISVFESKASIVVCPYCKRIVKKYVESHYTGGMPCVLLAKYCRWCGESLKS